MSFNLLIITSQYTQATLFLARDYEKRGKGTTISRTDNKNLDFSSFRTIFTAASSRRQEDADEGSEIIDTDQVVGIGIGIHIVKAGSGRACQEKVDEGRDIIN